MVLKKSSTNVQDFANIRKDGVHSVDKADLEKIETKKRENAFMSKEQIIGYTTGVYDLFHIGHLNLLKNAKGMCDHLVVGVSVDELVAYKGKHALIPFEDRIEIVRSCRYVDAAVPQYDMDKLTACKKIGAKILFVGDDWYETDKWKEYEKQFSAEGIKIVYFPYTKGISTTKIANALQQIRGWSTETARKTLHLNEDSNDR